MAALALADAFGEEDTALSVICVPRFSRVGDRMDQRRSFEEQQRCFRLAFILLSLLFSGANSQQGEPFFSFFFFFLVQGI